MSMRVVCQFRRVPERGKVRRPERYYKPLRHHSPQPNRFDTVPAFTGEPARQAHLFDETARKISFARRNSRFSRRNSRRSAN